MGSELQQRAVLEARGLALSAVGHHDRAPAPRGDRAHLGGGGERGATVPEQPGALDLLDQRLRVLARAPAASAAHRGQRTVDGEVPGQRHGPVAPHAGEQPGQRGSGVRTDGVAGSALGDGGLRGAHRLLPPALAVARLCEWGSSERVCPSAAPIRSRAGRRAATREEQPEPAGGGERGARTPTFSGQPAIARARTAASTSATQTTLSTSSQRC